MCEEGVGHSDTESAETGSVAENDSGPCLNQSVRTKASGGSLWVVV